MDPTTGVTLGIAACAAKGPGGSSGPARASTRGCRLCAGAPPTWPPTTVAALRWEHCGAVGPLTSVLPWVGPELVLQWPALSFGKLKREAG